MEETVHLNNVWVVEKETDLKLLRELLQHQSHRFLLYLLYCNEEACFFVDCRKDFAESAFSATRSHLKICQT